MRYKLRNFRIFEQEAEFNLAPITCLVGKNNSGKSTMTKSVMLCQEFFENIRRDLINKNFTGWEDYTIDFTSGIHKLGSFNRLHKGSHKEFYISFSYKSFLLAPEGKDINISFTFVPKTDVDCKPCFEAVVKGVNMFVDNEVFYTYDRDENIDTFRFTLLKKCFCEEIAKAKCGNNTTRSRLQSVDVQSLLDDFHSTCTDELQSLLNGAKDPKSVEKGFVFYRNYLDKIGDKSTVKQLQKSITAKANTQTNKLLSSILDLYDFSKRTKMLSAEHWLYSEFDKYLLSHSGKCFSDFYLDAENAYLNSLSRKQPHPFDSVKGFFESNIRVYLNYAGRIQKALEKTQLYDAVEDFFDVNQEHPAELKLPFIYAILQNVDSSDESMSIGSSISSVSPFHVVRQYAHLVLAEAFFSNDKLTNAQFIPLERSSAMRMYLFDDQSSRLTRLLSAYIKIPDKFKVDGKIYNKGNVLRESIADLTQQRFYDVEIDYGREAEGVYVYIVDDNGYRLTLADVGYGMTPLMLVLLQIEICIYSKSIHLKSEQRRNMHLYKNSTIYIEEPGCNMHPDLQVLFMRKLVDVYEKYGIEFVLETHSEYIVRALQVFVRQRYEGLSSDEVALHYIENGTSRLINIKESGSLSDRFGEGFYDTVFMLSNQMFD